jgi:glycosyltransferase involved in cell wall biosynthesis
LDLSIVIPVFNEIESVDTLCERLNRVLPTLGRSYEVILIDDGSRDGTFDRLVEISRRIPCLRLIRFRRNFGQTAAMAAGFRHAEGEIIITLDADLQNPPEEIPKLLAVMTPDVDVVSGWRKERQDTFLTRRLPSMLANGLISKITGVRLHDYGCTLKAYRREVVRNVRLYGEMHRFIPALASWVGGRVEEVVVGHAARQHGTSKYGLGRTFRVVLDLITVKFLLRYSMGPMQIFGKIGAIFGVPGLLLLMFLVGSHASHLLFGTDFAATLIKRPFWLMTSFMGIFFGVQFVSLGLLAEIQIRTYHESQDKETYVIREIVKSSS